MIGMISVSLSETDRVPGSSVPREDQYMYGELNTLRKLVQYGPA